MTQPLCPTCRTRFTREAAAHLRTCPTCAAPLEQVAGAAALGFPLVTARDLADAAGTQPSSEPSR